MTPEPTKEQREAAKRLANDIYGALPGDEWRYILAFLAARDAELIRPWREAVEKIDRMVKSAHSPRWAAVLDITRAILSPAPKEPPGGTR